MKRTRLFHFGESTILIELSHWLLILPTEHEILNECFFFRRGSLQMDVENTGKIDVPHHLFDAHSDCDPLRQGNDMALNSNMVLGCDILFKNFTVMISKKQGSSPL